MTIRHKYAPIISHVIRSCVGLAILVCSVQAAFADPQIIDDNPAPRASTPDRLHSGIGSTVRKMADRLDRFFGDERIDEEEQDTTLRLKPTLRWENGEGTDLSLRVRLNLALPRLENRWHVLVKSVSDDESLDDEDRPGTSVPMGSEDQDTRTLLGIRFAPIAEQLQHLSFSGGGKIRDSSVHPYTRARYRRTRNFDQWSAELTQSLFYFSDDGFGETTRIIFERRIREKNAFRTTTKATWSETSEGVDYEQILMLRRFLEEDKAIEYSIGAAGHTHPSTIVEEYVAQVAYRQELYNQWVFWEVGTQAIFPKDQDYHFVPAVFTSIALVF